MKSSTKIAAVCVLFSALSVSAQTNNMPVQKDQQKSKIETIEVLKSNPIGKDTLLFRGERQEPDIKLIPNNLATTEDLMTLDFKLFPNPSQGRVQLEFAENTSPEKIEVYSVIGNLVFQQEIDNSSTHEISLDLSQLNAGNYIVVATGKSKVHTQKLSIN